MNQTSAGSNTQCEKYIQKYIQIRFVVVLLRLNLNGRPRRVNQLQVGDQCCQKFGHNQSYSQQWLHDRKHNCSSLATSDRCADNKSVFYSVNSIRSMNTRQQPELSCCKHPHHRGIRHQSRMKQWNNRSIPELDEMRNLATCSFQSGCVRLSCFEWVCSS